MRITTIYYPLAQHPTIRWHAFNDQENTPVGQGTTEADAIADLIAEMEDGTQSQRDAAREFRERPCFLP